MAKAFLSKGDPDGSSVGQTASDPIHFYGGTPVVQPSGNGGVALSRGSACGSIATYGTTQSPSAVTTSTTAEFAMTVVAAASASYQIQTGDMLYINKPTAQAGLGMGNVRVSGANSIAVTFSNFTSATITPTASQKYGVVGLRGFNMITTVLTPAAVAANSTVEQLFTVTGVRTSELVQIMKPTLNAGVDIVGCRVAANNQIGVTFCNVTAAVVTPTAGETYTVYSLGGIDSANNDVLAVNNFGVQAAVGGTTTTTVETSITVTGIALTDTIKGVSKPTAQAGLGIVGYRVSAANLLAVTWLNTSSSGITATASEAYGVSLFRPNPLAPLVNYTSSLSPSSVAPNTTAEQTFTVTGLIASTPVWVNKPTAQAGLGIAGVRVSATNTLAINFSNSSASTITPTAGETYIIGNFQQAIPDGASAWVYTASTVDQQQSVLLTELRRALVALGAHAGA